MSLIESGEIETSRLNRYEYCQLSIITDAAPLRVGPGIDRGVRLIADEGEIFHARGFAEVEDTLWYQIDTFGTGLLWVSELDAQPTRESGRQISNTNCFDLPRTDAPPVIARTQQDSSDIASIRNCSNFTIIRPVGTVPAGESTYRWTPVEGADRYVLNFTDYQGNYAGSFDVDGSQTSALINTSSFPTGSQLSFDIVAMSGEERLCRTFSGPLTRTANFVEPAPEETPVKKKKHDDGDNSGGYVPPVG